MSDPDFTIGIEEEYLLVDTETMALAEAPEALMADCSAALEGQFSPEFLQCQVEIGTRVCANVTEAREDLKRLRSTVAKAAAAYGLAPIAASCHPFADWKQQSHTDRERYKALHRSMGSVADRLLICGMHVHVGLGDDTLRIDLMRQASYFLPHLLALSASSPFWQGQDTRMASFRISVFDNMPRTGLPPQFSAWSDYQRSVDTLVDLGCIEDSTKIWWDMRPSARFPTLETRIMDVQPRLEHALTLAALNQCLMRMLTRLRRRNQRWRIYDPFLIAENRWRAQRYGTTEGLIDFGEAAIKPFPELMSELVGLLSEDAAALGCTDELAAVQDILASGTSAERQRAVLTEESGGSDAGEPPAEPALRAVVAHLIEEYHADL
ncbi:carboxylate-amine ligase [Poseidonocella sedimentorum]|uniref:Putative glutamate--cysteine ligase 2 n=1 Tax=Poseidonocella sedimentorum TaxID=871652 RepID=A0A1I6EIU5_9RHOB|nr:carboxylate-amine ligase [Poseidonocella sedimentorum]SFR17402.1 carboxylate-amine ligase [Poseidonocella sedimentorum]